MAPRRLATVRLLLTVPLLTAWAASTQAQDAEVNAEPAECYLGQEIRVFGFVKPGGGGRTSVTLTFTPPAAGAPTPIVERVQAER